MIDQAEAMAGIRAKLARAREHLEQLDAEMSAFIARHPKPIRPHAKPQPNVFVYGVFVPEPFPLRWNVIGGEIIHNLHSALDHAINQLVRARGVAPTTSKTGFPIFDDQTKFGQRGGTMTNGVGSGVDTFVRALQPHNRPVSTVSRMLGSLYEMWNQDKHRIILRWGVQFQDENTEFDPAPREIIWQQGLLKHKAEVLRLVYDTDPGDVNMKGGVTIQIALDDPIPGTNPDETLWAFHDAVVGVAHLLLAAIKDQDRPIL